MSSRNTVAVDPAQLVEHARRLDESARTIEPAIRAAGTVRLEHGAYGQLCASVPVVLDRLSGPLADGLRALLVSTRDTADRLRRTAEAYGAAEERALVRTRGATP